MANPPTAAGTAEYPHYAVNERVLCYHGPLVYEAKILKTTDFKEPALATGLTGMHYFVHYKGWKQTWDEWVHASRLLKLNDANLALQKRLQNEHLSTTQHASSSASASSKSHKAGGAGASSTSGGGAGGGGSARTAARKDGRGTKRGRDEDDSARKPEMKLNVPEVLKSQLVDDWEAVTKKFQVRGGRFFGVGWFWRRADVRWWIRLCRYRENRPLRDPSLLLSTVISGIQVYFDKSLGSNLLYRFERPQYSEIRKKYWTGQQVVVGVTEKEMSEIYGGEHLLRMIVSLPQMIAQTSLDPESVSLIRDYVNELLHGALPGDVGYASRAAFVRRQPRVRSLAGFYTRENANPSSGHSCHGCEASSVGLRRCCSCYPRKTGTL
ncbi:hypothetical protein CC1G_02678 [Coprinopsis cinerea okayama7|uniref:Chromatin modification-related protein EAF3 n=1 Tax=Coprinopsis cinerea (strain Okayama-7 / 130 / ATCC MYA-4618 / FGSC 9003) TaxID=240176 RepID=A8PBL8_COPC7|nr:hypothetical protein CC1G_02678 [Coprinopsis cinerea okayama7\|eukprot:XP_001840215.2 hypothetical protein CC1G_02678 [Coprinopsis cinerea okayama7\